MKSRPAEERKRERCREMDSGGRGEREPNKERRECASVKSESERSDGGRAAGTRGVNDVRIVQSRHRPLWSLHMLAPAAQPTVDGRKSCAHTCCSGTTCQPKATCAGAGADLRSPARPLKFWPLRLLGDTVSHCEFFFSSPVGCVPSVRKCVTAFQKQHLCETVPSYASVIHVCLLTNTD